MSEGPMVNLVRCIPTVIPYCALCHMPVQRIGYDVPKSPLDQRFGISAQCCGKTQGRWVTMEEVRRLKISGEKLYLVVQANRVQQIKPEARR